MPDLTANQLTAAHGLLKSLAPGLGLALSEHLNQEVSLELLDVHKVPLPELLARKEHVVQTPFTVSHPEGSECVFFLSESTAGIFVSLIEGVAVAEEAGPLSDAQFEALSTAMAGLVNGLSVGLENLTGDHYDIEAGATHAGSLTVPPVFALEGSAVEVRFSISIAQTADAELGCLLTAALLTELAPPAEVQPASGGSGIAADDDAEAGDQSGEDDFALEPEDPSAGAGAAFRAADRGAAYPEPFRTRGLEMILDIPLDVTVELGRVRMLIKDVLELASGSIIELDRVAGEPVDLLVNGRLVAKGEVVVIEDNFGIRITEIVSPAERVAGLGKGERR